MNKEVKKSFIQAAGNILLVPSLTFLCKSLFVKYQNKEVIDQFYKQKKNFIVVFWHGSMLMGWYPFRGRKFSALISKSKDGQLLTNVLTAWRFNVIRGSSNEGGNEALTKMIEAVKNGNSLAITPDGPKGPAHKMKAGAVIVAKKTGLPIILTSIHYSKKRVFTRSWDKFEIPFPFSRIQIEYSEPIYVSGDLNYDQTNEMILDCERQLNDMHSKINEK